MVTGTIGNDVNVGLPLRHPSEKPQLVTGSDRVNPSSSHGLSAAGLAAYSRSTTDKADATARVRAGAGLMRTADADRPAPRPLRPLDAAAEERYSGVLPCRATIDCSDGADWCSKGSVAETIAAFDSAPDRGWPRVSCPACWAVL